MLDVPSCAVTINHTIQLSISVASPWHYQMPCWSPSIGSDFLFKIPLLGSLLMFLLQHVKNFRHVINSLEPLQLFEWRSSSPCSPLYTAGEMRPDETEIPPDSKMSCAAQISGPKRAQTNSVHPPHTSLWMLGRHICSYDQLIVLLSLM